MEFPTFAGDNGPATSAQIDPVAVAVDSQGNLYIADGFNFRIRKVDTNGIITTIAGTGSEGNTGDNGPATSAVLDFVTDLAVDNAGNIYLADLYNYEVRKIDATGMMTAFAGGFQNRATRMASQRTTAAMAPDGVAFDASGNLYISDENIYNTVIRRVDLSTGLIYTVAGTGVVGFTGDAAPALAAELNEPGGLAVSGGVIYFADEANERVRKIANYVITTVAGTGIRDTGPATNAFLNFPEGIAIDGSGDILVADTGNAEARKFKAAGNINSIGQLQGGPPYGVTADQAGNFYLTDEEPMFPYEIAARSEGGLGWNYDGRRWQWTRWVLRRRRSGDPGRFKRATRVWPWMRPEISISPTMAITVCARSTPRGTSTRLRGTARFNSPATMDRRLPPEWIPSIWHWTARETFWLWISSTIACARSRPTIRSLRWWEPGCRALRATEGRRRRPSSHYQRASRWTVPETYISPMQATVRAASDHGRADHNHRRQRHVDAKHG